MAARAVRILRGGREGRARRQAVCQPERNLLGVAPAAAECDTAALTRNREFGQKYNITGTPTLIFSDGTRAPGAIPAAQVEKQLASIN